MGRGWQAPLLWQEAESRSVRKRKKKLAGKVPLAPGTSPTETQDSRAPVVTARPGQPSFWQWEVHLSRALSCPSTPALHGRARVVLRKYGLQRGAGQDPGSTQDPLGRGEDCSQSLKLGQEATAEAVGGHYTKASRLDEPLILRNSLLSSLFW